MNIFFLMDAEAGHILPTFKMADNFTDVGYTPIYITLEKQHQLIIDAGYKNLIIFPKEDIEVELINDKKRSSSFNLLIIDGYLDYLIEEFNPCLIVATLFLPWKAFLLSLKYKTPLFVVYSAPELKILEKGPLNQFKDFLEEEFSNFSGLLPMKIYEFLKKECPNFDQANIDKCVNYYFLYHFPLDILLGNVAHDEQTFFIGPHIREEKLEDKALTLILNQIKNKKILYGSLGSQSSIYKEKSLKFYQLLIAMMQEKELLDYHLILSINSDFVKKLTVEEKSVTNITFMNWVSQLQVLKRTQLFITHAGRGGIKEAINAEVPMLAFPMGRDQYENAMLIREKQLGDEMDVDNDDIKQLIYKVKSLIENTTIKNNLNKLNQLFVQQENLKIEVKLLNEILFDSVSI